VSQVWRRKASSGSGETHNKTSDENRNFSSGGCKDKYSSSSPFSPTKLNSPVEKNMLSTRKILSELTNIDTLSDSPLICEN
jgi:hypothetical protein